MKDCIIIGAGPAGLTAAIYLKRFRRDIQVIDAGASRASLIPTSHNFPGMPEGISGDNLLKKMRAHLGIYNETVLHDEVINIEKYNVDNFLVSTGNTQLTAKRVLLATGVMDIEPPLPNVENAIKRGLIRHCTICDGYEVIDQKIGIIGHGTQGLKEALFMLTYSNDITLLTLGEEMQLCKAELQQLNDSSIKVITDIITHIEIKNNKIGTLQLKIGKELLFDTLYSALGMKTRSDLAIKIGAKHLPDGCSWQSH